MKRLLLISLLLIVGGFAIAQCTFDSNYGYRPDSIYDFGSAVIQTQDGGYVAVGNTNTVGFLPPYEGVFIIRTDRCGDTIWQKSYDLSVGADPGYSIVELQDQSIVICGTKYDSIEGASDSYLLKLDQNGDSLWQQTVEGGYNDWGWAHRSTADNGFIIAGFRNVQSPGGILLMKTDSLGNLEWKKEHGVANWDIVKSLDISTEGGYIIGGYFANDATLSWDMFILKADSLGNQLWKKSYGTGSQDEYYGYAISTLDGGYAIAGYREYANGNLDGYLVKTDSAGNVEWEKLYGIPVQSDHFHHLLQLPDSSYIVGGTFTRNAGPITGPQAWLLKLNSIGDTIWTRSYSYYGGTTHTYMEDLQPTADCGFIMTGYVINNALPQYNDVWMLKVDSMGNFTNGCDTATCDTVVCQELNSVVEEQITEEGQLLIYPNPTTGTFTVQGAVNIIQVYDLFGRLMLRTNKRQVDMSTQPKGVYIVKAGEAVRKLIVH